MSQLWEIVGGKVTGGLLVRTGPEFSASKAQARLSTGALVKELELVGDRLHYELVDGSGPQRGWISINLKDKSLAVRSSAVPSASLGSLQHVDTKISGRVDASLLDTPGRKTSTAAGPDPSNGSTTQATTRTSAANISEALIAQHVRAIVQSHPNLSALTPKMIMLEVSSRLSVHADEMKGYMPCIKKATVVELQEMLNRRADPAPDKGPADAGFKLPKSIRPRTESRQEPKPGTVEAIASAHVKAGRLVDAIAVLSQEIERLAATSASLADTSSSGFPSEPDQKRSELLVARGHLKWKNLQYMDAQGDFAKSEALLPGGVAGASLLALRFCLGLDLQFDTVMGQDDLKHLLSEAIALSRASSQAMARQRHLFHPRSEVPHQDCDKKPIWATSGMQIFDGACVVEPCEDRSSAEIGYRLMVSRKSPPEETSLMIYYHGNGEVCTDYTDFAEVYEKFPCTFMCFDYRAYGWSTGEPDINCLTKDPAACVNKLPQLLRRHGLPWPWPAPLILMGRSLGSAVAGSLIGKFPDLFSGLIIESGMASSKEDRYQGLLDFAGSRRAEVEEGFRLIRTILQDSLPTGCVMGEELIAPYGTCDTIRGYRGAVLVLHGQMDFIVPLQNGIRNYEAATNACQRELSQFPADHNSCAGLPEFWQKQLRFARSVVARGTGS